MKCPSCGRWNKPSFPRCMQCGEPLNARQANDPQWREQFERPQPRKVRVVYDDTEPPVEDIAGKAQGGSDKEAETLALEMTRLKDRRARGAMYQEALRRSAAQQGIAPSSANVSVRRRNRFYEVPDDPQSTLYTPDGWRPGGGPQNEDGMEAAQENGALYDSPDESAWTQAEDAGPVRDSDGGGNEWDTEVAQEAQRDRVRTRLERADGRKTYEMPRTLKTRTVAVDPSIYMPQETAASMYEADIPPEFDTPGPIAPAARKRRRFRRIRGPMLIAYILVGVLVMGVVSFGVYAFASSVLPSLTTRRTSMEKADNVFIEPIDLDGLAGRRVRISGEEGTQIYIAEMMKTYVVVGGFATVDVPDHIFYDTIDHLEASTMDVALTPTVVRSGTETRLDFIRYTIDIPASALHVIKPEADEITVNTSKYSVEMQVSPGSKVFINGEDRSDTVKEDGRVTANVPVLAIGSNVVTISVQAPYCRETNKKIVLYRAPMEIPLELDAATLMNTTDERLTIYATTQVGAQITIESPHFELNTDTLGTDGKFWVAAKMGRVGNNTIIIRATYEGKADSVIEHVVYYLPPESVYTTKAWKLGASDYSELMNNIALRMEKAQIYLCTGVIKEVLSENPQLVLMDTGTDGVEQLVMLENQTASYKKGILWQKGEEYRVFADVSGVYNKMPRLIGRYTYDIPKEEE